MVNYFFVDGLGMCGGKDLSFTTEFSDLFAFLSPGWTRHHFSMELLEIFVILTEFE